VYYDTIVNGQVHGWTETRCDFGTGGWAQTNPGNPMPNPIPLPPDGPGSFIGNGSPQPPPTEQPCNPIPTEHLSKMETAKALAKSKLTRVKVGSTGGQTLPTTCTVLFRNSPLGMSGLQLLESYANFRYGQGCDPPGPLTNGCGTGSAFTSRGTHDRNIFVCNSFFNLGSHEARAEVLIHELLHTAGQDEDGTPYYGPGNAPTSSQLNGVVHEACSPPQVINP
jgi:hypothetical protein